MSSKHYCEFKYFLPKDPRTAKIKKSYSTTQKYLEKTSLTAYQEHICLLLSLFYHPLDSHLEMYSWHK